MDFSFINTVYWVDDNGSGKPVKIKQLFVPLAVIAVAMAIVGGTAFIFGRILGLLLP